METFIYKGIIAEYKIKDGKIVVSEVFYNGQQNKCDNVFSSVGEMRRFIDAGGWITQNN